MPATVVRCWWWRALRAGGALAVAAVAAAGIAHLVRAWTRYGHTRPQANPLLDAFMPNPEVAERHQVSVHAPATATLAAARAFDMWESPVVRAVFHGRELLMGLPGSPQRPPTPFLREAEAMGWGLLANDPQRGVAYGAVTKPWEARPQFDALPPEDFAAFSVPGYAKIVWSLQVEAEAPDACRLSTETRVETTDADSRARFRRYWTVLSVGILLIRWVTLRRVRQKVEAQFP